MDKLRVLDFYTDKMVTSNNDIFIRDMKKDVLTWTLLVIKIL
jgi:hypothetical protein